MLQLRMRKVKKKKRVRFGRYIVFSLWIDNIHGPHTFLVSDVLLRRQCLRLRKYGVILPESFWSIFWTDMWWWFWRDLIMINSIGIWSIWSIGSIFGGIFDDLIKWSKNLIWSYSEDLIWSIWSIFVMNHGIESNHSELAMFYRLGHSSVSIRKRPRSFDEDQWDELTSVNL